MIDSKKNNHLLIQPITRDTVLNTSPSASTGNNTFVVHDSVVTEEPSRMLSRLQDMLHDSSSSDSDSKITHPQHIFMHGDRSVRKIQPQLMPQTI